MQGNAVKLFAFARTIVVGSLFVWFFGWILPIRIIDPHATITTVSWLRLLALLFLILGSIVAATCALTFPFAGDGTPAPFDPPRKLVKAVLYRHSRNPMYVGFFMVVLGEALLLQSIAIGGLLLFYVIAANLFVRFYEEPVLRRKFGTDYDGYRASVRRWI